VGTDLLVRGRRKFRDGYAGSASISCAASPQVVYDILADLRTHVVWGGSENGARMQHLLAIDCPFEPATAGTEFRSVGYTSHGAWHDHSTVTEATPPSVFAFATMGTMRSHSPFHGSWVHRYEIEPNAGGSEITYHCRWQLTRVIADGSRIRRSVFCQLVLPVVWEAGLQGIAAMAEGRLAEPGRR